MSHHLEGFGFSREIDKLSLATKQNTKVQQPHAVVGFEHVHLLSLFSRFPFQSSLLLCSTLPVIHK